MKKLRPLLSGMAIGAVLALILLFALRSAWGTSSKTTLSSTTLKNSLQEANSLVSTQYDYANIGKFTNSLDLNGWTVPFTEKNFILTYQGQILLGVHMENAEVKVNPLTHTIKIHCPAVEILSNVIDENSIEVYDESQNIFNPISVSDYISFAAQEKEKAAAELEEKGAFEKAEKNAEASILQLLNMIPEVKDTYTIEITFDKRPEPSVQEEIPAEDQETLVEIDDISDSGNSQALDLDSQTDGE